MATKNNPNNRKAEVKKKQHNGKEVDAVFYHGVNAGHGKYMTAVYAGTNNLVVDTKGKPLHWDAI